MIQRDLIFYCKRIWLPSGHAFLPMLLIEFHTTPLGGHLGIEKTLHRLQEKNLWSNMHKDVLMDWQVSYPQELYLYLCR